MESPLKSAVPNWEAKGYTRMFFSKSAQLFWNLWLAKNTENRSVQGIVMKALTRARVRKSQAIWGASAGELVYLARLPQFNRSRKRELVKF